MIDTNFEARLSRLDLSTGERLADESGRSVAQGTPSPDVEIYKNFLRLIKKYPNKELVPSKEIDRVWHMHILNTRRYMSDCHALFGEYIHHNPTSESAAESALPAFLETCRLFKREFGIDMCKDTEMAAVCNKCSKD